ncbi:MAG: hypothetical protein AAB116_24755, partial [Candidatus Poribacteria bacterium]
WQKLYEPYDQFRPWLPTTVIVHGANPTEEVELPSWMLEIAKAINDFNNYDMNIVAWNWMEEAKGNGGGKNMMNQAHKLTTALVRLFETSNYSKVRPIHLMGHSMGAHMVAWCGAFLIQPAVGSYSVRQVTLWDPPEVWEVERFFGTNISKIDNPISYVHQNSDEFIGEVTYVELYDGPFGGLLTGDNHGVDIWVDVPNQIIGQPYFGHGVFDWYRDTIGLASEPVVFDSDMSAISGKTIGYGTTNPEKRLDATCNSYCEATKTVVVQYAGWKSGEEGYFKQERDCGSCELLAIQKMELIAIQGLQQVGEGIVDLIDNVLSLIPGGSEKTGQKFKLSDFALSCSFPVVISEEWDYLSFDYEFVGDIEGATFSFTIRFNGEDYPALTIQPTELFRAGSLSLLPIDTFRGQETEFVFELTSENPGTQVNISNLTLLQDIAHTNLPPVADAGLNAFCVDAGPIGACDITLSAADSIDPEGEHLWYRWYTDERAFIDDSMKVMLHLLPGDYLFILQVTDEFGATDEDSVNVSVRLANVPFIRGDSNRDGTLDIADPVTILSYLFASVEVTCLDACDVNDSGQIDIADPIYELDYLFAHKDAPPVPFPVAGIDETDDSLNCQQ